MLIENRVEWQIECDNVIKNKNNVILSSPTGSGKTKRYENWALKKVERPIFITSPIKSLSNQRFRELQREGHKVGLETGDIKYFPNSDCDIICCTQEIYNNKYRELENSTLIIDEFSYIFEDEERARVYIDSLYYTKAKNIMLCSATFGNPNEIKEYINKVTNREFFLFENTSRLTSLEYKGEISKEHIYDSLVVTYSKTNCELIARDIYKDRINRIYSLMKKAKYSYDPRMRHKKEIEELVEKYNIDNNELIELSLVGVVYYYGGLYPKEKLFIEELFEKRLIDSVVGTDALALGVNFPIKNVIFTQLKKAIKSKEVEISKNQFEQLSGRAGRKGYFEEGYVYFCKDYSKEFDPSINQTFYKLVNSKNEKVNISLNANIKDILMKNKSIEEEAMFISNYSTNIKNYEEEKNKIKEIIDYISNFDVASYYLKKKYYNFNFSEGYIKAIEDCSTKFQNKFKKLSESLMNLQPYFDKDIKNVYISEFSPEKNCIIFIDILMEVSLEEILKKYGKSFYDILILRKYLNNLPEKYLKNYDLFIIDEIIESMDFTVLHPEKIKINKIVSPKKIETNKKNKQKINYPNYFEKIYINNKEYIKILIDNNQLLVYEEFSENLLYIPLNIYKSTGILSPIQGLEILNNVDLSTYLDEDLIEKITELKTYLENKYKPKIKKKINKQK